MDSRVHPSTLSSLISSSSPSSPITASTDRLPLPSLHPVFPVVFPNHGQQPHLPLLTPKLYPPGATRPWGIGLGYAHDTEALSQPTKTWWRILSRKGSTPRIGNETGSKQNGRREKLPATYLPTTDERETQAVLYSTSKIPVRCNGSKINPTSYV